MKKLFSLLLCAALVLCAHAEAPEETPQPDRVETLPLENAVPRLDKDAYESITLVLDGEPIELPFDSSPQYSSIEGGVVQSSFYNYSADGATLYELYIVFPESALPGEVITSQSAAVNGEEASVVLIVSDVRTEQEEYYFSSVMGGTVYPETSDFSIGIDAVDDSGRAVTYGGRLSATLVALDMSTGEVSSTLAIPEAAFSFTISEEEQDRHSSPLPTPLTGDMRKV